MPETSRQTSVAIIDGIAEGKWNTKVFREYVRQHGFKITDTIEEADIIFSHSAGCFFLPKSDNKQTIILVNPPYWPGKPLALSIIHKIFADFIHRNRERNYRFWIYKNAVSTMYLFADIVRSIHIGLFARRRDFHERLPNKKIIVIRNNDDAWCTPDLEKIPFKNPDVSFVRLPGEHDDCWIHPERYIDILQKEMV